ncbi:hypothetical protein K9L97_02295 [Candidatus Woesearchaeota archaeon]|nr:hypothetical protein [Candidatus Woesearchaeota archaeon]
MVVIKFLGFVDIIAAIIITLFNFELVPLKIFLSIFLYLILKGLAFRGDFASFTDIGIAIYMLLMLIYPITIITLICSLFLFQKGIFSML